MNGLSKENVSLNRKVLSEIAMHEPYSFKTLVEISRIAFTQVKSKPDTSSSPSGKDSYSHVRFSVVRCISSYFSSPFLERFPTYKSIYHLYIRMNKQCLEIQILCRTTVPNMSCATQPWMVKSVLIISTLNLRSLISYKCIAWMGLAV